MGHLILSLTDPKVNSDLTEVEGYFCHLKVR